MVDSAVLVRGPSTTQPIKRRSIEKPRPLRTDPDLVCLQEILKLIEEVDFMLRNNEARNDMRARLKVQQLKELLRLKGGVVERNRKEVLDVMEITMKETCRDRTLDVVTRLNLLEIMELRLNNWQFDPTIAAMYRQKIAEAQLDIDMKKIGFAGDVDAKAKSGADAPQRENILNLMSSTSSSGNSSPECPAGTAIKQLLQPEMKAERPDPCSAFLAPPDHCASLLINGDRILISSNNQDLVKTSKDVLQEFFAVMNEDTADVMSQLPKPEICYEKDELMRLSKSPLCKQAPTDWDKIIGELPIIAKKPEASGKHFLREMEGIRRQEATFAPLRKM